MKTISISLVALLLCSSAMAVIIETDPNTAPYDDHVNNGAFSTGLRANGAFNDSADIGLAQTMTTGAGGLDFQYVHMVYSAVSNAPVTLHIFEVADVTAGTIAVPGTTLLSVSFTAPSSGGSSDFLTIGLDGSVTLAANTGYAFYIDNTLDGLSKNDGFKWRRSGSTVGDFYAGGAFYDEDGIKNSGARDGLIALDSIPEPATLGLMSACAVGAFMIRRFRV